ncbi:MAG: hypothetical protein WCW27_03235 [Patescibacteria group bacterium]|jgi:hypothetical protein
MSTRQFRGNVPKGILFRNPKNHDITASTLKLVNVQLVEHQADLLHLVANALKKFSTEKSVLVKMQATATVITYWIVNKKLAATLGKKVQSAFKHYHPVVDITYPKDESFYTVTVTFQEPK